MCIECWKLTCHTSFLIDWNILDEESMTLALPSISWSVTELKQYVVHVTLTSPQLN
jgi:hypothetical protein